MRVLKTSQPPSRREGGGFTIKDILSGFGTAELDPFLIWHELPRTRHGKGDMPGAPMHPHRGFMECPYAKEIGGDTPFNYMNGAVEAGGKSIEAKAAQGNFELGKVGVGMQHEALVDPRWEGTMHFFQLWVNLPSANKFDAPHFQEAPAEARPLVTLCEEPRVAVSVLHGEVAGEASPTVCDVVRWTYLDFAVAGGGRVEYTPPAGMTTRLIFVYSGQIEVGGEAIGAGTVAMLSKAEGETFEAVAAGGGGGEFLFIAGAPIGEPVVQHGPFVMSTREQIMQCFQDYQSGQLCPKPLTLVNYGGGADAGREVEAVLRAVRLAGRRVEHLAALEHWHWLDRWIYLGTQSRNPFTNP